MCRTYYRGLYYSGLIYKAHIQIVATLRRLWRSLYVIEVYIIPSHIQMYMRIGSYIYMNHKYKYSLYIKKLVYKPCVYSTYIPLGTRCVPAFSIQMYMEWVHIYIHLPVPGQLCVAK